MSGGGSGWEVAHVVITTAKPLLYKALLIFNKIVLETQLDQKLLEACNDFFLSKAL